MEDFKKILVTMIGSASGTSEHGRVRLVTAAGYIEGRIVRDFDKNLVGSGMADAFVLDKIAEATNGDESLTYEFLFLADVKFISGERVIPFDHLLVFTDEIIGITFGLAQ